MKKYYLLTPGPTPVPPNVAGASARPILHHRTHEFGAVFDEVMTGLKYVFQTKNDVLLLTSSGTGSMEASVANLLKTGDKVIVATSGAFGDRWIKICQAFGITPKIVAAEWGQPVDPEAIRKVLQEIPDAVAVFTTHTETSTGTVNALKTIGEIVSQTNAVLVVDAISGLGGQELYSDDWRLDCVVSGSQKGLMNAPGLAFASVSPKAWKLVEKANLPRFYWDFRRIKASITQKETPFTPAVTLVVGLAESLRMIKEETLPQCWARHERLANCVQAGFQALGLKLFSSAPCNVLTAAALPPEIDGKKIVKKMRDDLGVSIAGGQEHLAGKIIRLAHMGFMDFGDVLVGLSALEKTLPELGYKVTPGTALASAQKVYMRAAAQVPAATPAGVL